MTNKIENKIRTILREDTLFHRYRGNDYKDAVSAAEILLGVIRGRQDSIDYLSSLNPLDRSLFEVSIYLLEGKYNPYLTKEEIEIVLQMIM